MWVVSLRDNMAQNRHCCFPLRGELSLNHLPPSPSWPGAIRPEREWVTGDSGAGTGYRQLHWRLFVPCYVFLEKQSLPGAHQPKLRVRFSDCVLQTVLGLPGTAVCSHCRTWEAHPGGLEGRGGQWANQSREPGGMQKSVFKKYKSTSLSYK